MILDYKKLSRTASSVKTLKNLFHKLIINRFPIKRTVPLHSLHQQTLVVFGQVFQDFDQQCSRRFRFGGLSRADNLPVQDK
jgi:hypothetical protein